jgi:hypothetical protein
MSIGVIADYMPGIMLPVIPESQQEVAERFSTLSRRKALTPVIDAIRSLFPDVEGLSLETDAGQNSLFADVRNLDERLPIGNLSAGFTKYVDILLSIAAAPNGIVLVDEIENGFYFQTASSQFAKGQERNSSQRRIAWNS